MSYADTQPLNSAPVPAPSYPAVVGPTAPAQPHQGMIWLDNGTPALTLNIYDNGVWTPLPSGTVPVGTLIANVAAPATKTSTGQVGQVAFDATHAYFCTAANTWVRVAIDGAW